MYTDQSYEGDWQKMNSLKKIRESAVTQTTEWMIGIEKNVQRVTMMKTVSSPSEPCTIPKTRRADFTTTSTLLQTRNGKRGRRRRKNRRRNSVQQQQRGKRSYLRSQTVRTLTSIRTRNQVYPYRVSGSLRDPQTFTGTD